MDIFVPICENREFQRMYARGKSFVGGLLVSYVRNNRCGDIRIGITTGKKIGNAVMRNRAKRLIREAFRMLAPKIKSGVDIVFVARAKIVFVKSTDVVIEMEKQLKRAGVLL